MRPYTLRAVPVHRVLHHGPCSPVHASAHAAPVRLVLRLAAMLAVFTAVAFAGAVAYFVREVRTYAPLTFEAAQTDPAQVAEFALGGRWTPAAWGFPVYHEETFRSEPDGLRLSAWIVPPVRADTALASVSDLDSTVEADSGSRILHPPVETDCALVFVHGRWDNRLKALKYLPLAREARLTRHCLTVFPDLRNSGRSDAGAPDMGWQFAEDLASTLEHLARTHGTRRVVVYAFSMGAMATAVMINRDDLTTRLRQRVVWLDRIVLDSPMANVDANVRHRADAMGLPGLLTATTLRIFDNAFVEGRLGEMRLGRLLNRVRIPVLILHSRADATTPWVLLDAERSRFADSVRTVDVDGAPHVHLVHHPATAAAYRAEVVPFLRRAAWRDSLAASVRRAP